MSPRDIAGVCRLLGLLEYFFRYIESFTSVAKSFYDFLTKPVSGNKPIINKSIMNWIGGGGEKHQVALEKLILAIRNPPILTYLDFSKDFILHVDASKYGSGYALYQKQ